MRFAARIVANAVQSSDGCFSYVATAVHRVYVNDGCLPPVKLDSECCLL